MITFESLLVSSVDTAIYAAVFASCFFVAVYFAASHLARRGSIQLEDDLAGFFCRSGWDVAGDEDGVTAHLLCNELLAGTDVKHDVKPVVRRVLKVCKEWVGWNAVSSARATRHAVAAVYIAEHNGCIAPRLWMRRAASESEVLRWTTTSTRLGVVADLNNDGGWFVMESGDITDDLRQIVLAAVQTEEMIEIFMLERNVFCFGLPGNPTLQRFERLALEGKQLLRALSSPRATM